MKYSCFYFYETVLVLFDCIYYSKMIFICVKYIYLPVFKLCPIDVEFCMTVINEISKL
jgi:hypothetical protein